MVRIGWEPTLDLGRKAFLAPLPTDAAGAPAESAILRQHRQDRLHLKRLFQSGPRMAQASPCPLSLTRLTMLTVSWIGFSLMAVILIVRVPNRPSRPKTISIPSVRMKVCAGRSRQRVRGSARHHRELMSR